MHFDRIQKLTINKGWFDCHVTKSQLQQFILDSQYYLMRARSGAIHCDSQSDFLELAQASQHRTNIFYDEKINKKVMAQIHQKNAQTNKPTAEIANPELSSEKAINRFNGFDFGLDNQQQLQQKQQISRINLLYTSQLDIGIVIDQKILKKDQDNIIGEQGSGRLDLKMFGDNSIIFRCWYFKDSQLNIKRNVLMGLYLDRCKMIIQMRQERLEVLSSRLCPSQQAAVLQLIKSQTAA